MPMDTLILTEYQSLRGVPLSDDQVVALRRLSAVIAVVPSLEASGGFDLTATSWIGVIDLGTVTIEIRPKVPLSRILFMISYSLDRRGWLESDADLEQSASLVEAVAYLFALHVRRAISRGVLHGYRNEEDALSVVRGRLRFDEQIRRRFGRFPPAEVRFDEFTVDIIENQLIKAALARLGRMRLRSACTRRLLKALTGPFQAVASVGFDDRHLPSVTYTRLNEHYRSAIALAKLILRSTAFDVRHGTVRATALLVDMNRVFEDFVVTGLREALGASEREFPQGAHGRTLRLDRAGAINLYPDLSWWIGGRCRFVGDVKYKRICGNASNDDLYQLLAYAVAANLTDALVIYSAGDPEARTYEIEHLHMRLHVLTLDLSTDPDDILGQLKKIVDRIVQLAGLSRPPSELQIKRGRLGAGTAQAAQGGG
jgi:5-methylcytosine-specific restriction enzyme subunit McrC